MINHSSDPFKYPSINHELFDHAIQNKIEEMKKTGKAVEIYSMSTVPVSELPSIEEYNKLYKKLSKK